MKEYNSGFPNDSKDTLKNMSISKKDIITFQGIDFILTPHANGYLAATTKLPGKTGNGGTKSMAIGDLIIHNQDE